MLTVTSPAFADNGRIPLAYVSPRGGGEGRSIPVSWSGAPSETASFVVAIVDEAPVARDWVHWAVTGIPATVTELPDGASQTGAMPSGAKEYVNTGGKAGYGGPNPPKGTGDHPYVVNVYAVSVPDVTLPEQPSAEEIDRALRGKVLASGKVTGLYSN